MKKHIYIVSILLLSVVLILSSCDEGAKDAQGITSIEMVGKSATITVGTIAMVSENQSVKLKIVDQIATPVMYGYILPGMNKVELEPVAIAEGETIVAISGKVIASSTEYEYSGSLNLAEKTCEIVFLSTYNAVPLGKNDYKFMGDVLTLKYSEVEMVGKTVVFSVSENSETAVLTLSANVIPGVGLLTPFKIEGVPVTRTETSFSVQDRGEVTIEGNIVKYTCLVKNNKCNITLDVEIENQDLAEGSGRYTLSPTNPIALKWETPESIKVPSNLGTLLMPEPTDGSEDTNVIVMLRGLLNDLGGQTLSPNQILSILKPSIETLINSGLNEVTFEKDGNIVTKTTNDQHVEITSPRNIVMYKLFPDNPESKRGTIKLYFNVGKIINMVIEANATKNTKALTGIPIAEILAQIQKIEHLLINGIWLNYSLEGNTLDLNLDEELIKPEELVGIIDLFYSIPQIKEIIPGDIKPIVDELIGENGTLKASLMGTTMMKLGISLNRQSVKHLDN